MMFKFFIGGIFLFSDSVFSVEFSKEIFTPCANAGGAAAVKSGRGASGVSGAFRKVWKNIQEVARARNCTKTWRKSTTALTHKMGSRVDRKIYF